jgi:hypothetical protein
LKEIEAYASHDKPSSNEMVVRSGAARGEHATTVPENEDIGRTGGKQSDGLGTKRYALAHISTILFNCYIFISLHGLSGVPASLQYLREEVRLAGPDWESLGAEWKTLTALWLCAEILLSKTGRTDLSFTEIHVSLIPDAWKDWMSAKVMNTDAHHPTQAFGLVFTDYLNKLPSSTMVIEGTVMTEIWCRPGTTGIIGLLPGHDWKVNLAHVRYIFNAILGQPEL